MFGKPSFLKLSGFLTASKVAAAPVDAFTETEVFHGFTINSGSQPSNVTSVRLPVLQSTAGIDTTQDAPVTTETPDIDVQTGQSAPPAVPFVVQGSMVEDRPEGDHVIGAGHDVTIPAEVDPDAVPTTFDKRRGLASLGAAHLTSVDGSASGAATHEGGFRLRFGITMDPGAGLIPKDGNLQFNAVDHHGEAMAPIPLPGSLPLLSVAFGRLALLRCRRRAGLSSRKKSPIRRNERAQTAKSCPRAPLRPGRRSATGDGATALRFSFPVRNDSAPMKPDRDVMVRPVRASLPMASALATSHGCQRHIVRPVRS